MASNTEIELLMERPIWQMTGREYVALHRYAAQERLNSDMRGHPLVRIIGIHALAEYLECSDSTVFKLRREGALEDAIISKVGKKIVFDGEKARELAQAYVLEHRQTRKYQNE